MRRAVVATAGTVVALVALLDYKSSGVVHSSNLAVGSAAGTTSPTTTSPTTTSPSTTSPSAPTPTTSATPTTAAPTTTAPTAATRTFTGTDVQYQYGTIVVQITVRSGRITAIRIPQESARDPRSESINSQAIPILTAEALKAQNMQFDVVSGATYTSDAFAQSFADDLQQEAKG